MIDHERPQAVFIHGAGAGGWEWTIWQRVFDALGWSVLAPDLAPADDGIGATRIEDYAGQVAAWCDASKTPALLVGASLGGLLALIVATRVQPTALVLVNPVAPAGIEPRPARRDYPDLVPWGSRRSLRSTQRALPDGDDAARLFAFRRWRDESGALLGDACAGIAVEAPRRPVLVLASEHDDECPASVSAALAVHLRADFRLLHGASHLGPLLGRDAATIAEDTWRWCAGRVAFVRGKAR
ncbi:MAG TPA: alpha/beta fold hydrolase [Rudaea sp.]|jgi:predicted alpha/beta hydrolase family esterase